MLYEMEITKGGLLIAETDCIQEMNPSDAVSYQYVVGMFCAIANMYWTK